MGHYSVTPKYNSTMARVRRVLTAHEFTPSEWRRLRDLGADYLFFGPQERRLDGFDPNTASGLAQVFAQGDVAIYKVESYAE